MSTLIRFPKKRYIIVKSTSSSGSGSSGSGSVFDRAWRAQGFWNGSSNLFPTLGKLGDAIQEGYTWENLTATTTLFGPDGGIIPAGATIRALIDEPGQTLLNWRIDENPILKEVLMRGNDAGGYQIKNLAAPSDNLDADTLLARNQAITAAVDALKGGVSGDGDTLKKLRDLITSLGEFAGDHDASTGFLPTTGTGLLGVIDKGDYWYITVAGTIAGLGSLGVGDILFSRVSGASMVSDFFYLPFAALVPDASESVKGKIQIATQAETDGGTNDLKSLTPLKLAQAIKKLDFIFAIASGTDTYTASLSPAIASYNTPLKVYILFTNANGGPATLNLNGLGAISIKKSGGTALAIGDISAGQILPLIYDGANFQVVGGGGGGGKLAIAKTYANIAALLADQASQLENAWYMVTDASTDTTVYAGFAIYQKLAATTASLTDYLKIGEAESLDIDLTGYAPLASPALTGNPTAPTQPQADNSTKLATTEYVDRPSSESAKGIIEIATLAETNTGTDDTRALTPKKLKDSDLTAQVNSFTQDSVTVAIYKMTNFGTP